MWNLGNTHWIKIIYVIYYKNYFWSCLEFQFAINIKTVDRGILVGARAVWSEKNIAQNNTKLRRSVAVKFSLAE